MIRILLVDDQNLVQQGIKSLLDGEAELKVIGTVENGRSAVAEIEYLRPDVVLLDIEMPGMDGITTTKYISRLSPKTKVIILSSHEDKKYVTQALMAGAKGYLLKNSLISDLKQAILAVNNGYSQIDSKLLAKVFDPSNLKPKKHQSNTNQAKHNQNQTKSNHHKLIKEQVQAREASLSVQSPELLEVESQQVDATGSPSGKYQLGTSSVNLVESSTSISKAKLEPRSQSEIIKAEISDLDVSERDTFIQDNKHNSDLLELGNSPTKQPESTLLTKNSEAKITDFGSSRSVVPNVESNDLNDVPKRGQIEGGRISHINQVGDRQDSLILQPISEQSGATKTVTRVATKPTMSTPYPSNLAKYTSIQKRNKSKFQKLFQKSLEYGWVWNTILMVLGGVIVIVIGNL